MLLQDSLKLELFVVFLLIEGRYCCHLFGLFTTCGSGNKASATVQPFLLLHLDIFPESVNTIEDALHLFAAPETLEGYRTSAGKAGLVSASKSVKLQKLSKVMILHLMRFSYGSEGSTKLHKPVHFPHELVLGHELMVSPSSEVSFLCMNS
ncbi:hypothetical protein BHE74_00029800 [Ensete ventricosum]|nr:hypothetical protein GW17_00003239 [Ensete ventricosum]RWW63045.1 hypothetical protein BHE74_00029800 [Ensete ventricosum]RZS16537.1 hypothetical protein BHM03_00048537 [Ensete ventricosum]